MSILIVNQSVIDTIASLFSFLLIVDEKMTGLSHDSIWDQFVCRVWLRRKPLACMMVTSTYGTVLLALSRYIAAVYPIYYKKVTSEIKYCEVIVAAAVVVAVVDINSSFSHFVTIHSHYKTDDKRYMMIIAQRCLAVLD